MPNELTHFDLLGSFLTTADTPVEGTETEEQKKADQPRDEQGRFTKQPEAAEVAAEPTQTEPEQEAPPSFRKEIDLGDGSGKQVFEAESLEALVDKLAEAQRHATLKIREQSRKLKTQKPSTSNTAPVKKLSPEDEFLVATEITQNPTKAFRKLFESEMGITLEAFQERLQQADSVAREKAIIDAGRKFISDHPDYVATESNGRRIEQQIRLMGGDITDPEDIAAAYQDLLSSGLLETKKTQAQPTTRIETKAQPTKKASSGLFNHSRSHETVADTPAGEFSPEEQKAFSRMSTEEAKAFINRKLREAAARRSQ